MFNTNVILLFLLAFASGTMMGISQKFLAGYSPLMVNAISQAIASLVFGAMWYFGGLGQSQSHSFHRMMLLLGLAFVGLNYAYSSLYGQGVMLAYVPIIATAGITIFLGLTGYLFFHEAFSWKFVIGAVMILGGMVVMVR